MNGPVQSVRVNRSEIDIPKDILKSQRCILAADSDIIDMRKNIDHHQKKREHYQKLINEDNKFNKESLRTSLTDMKVELRKMNDIIDACMKKKEHHAYIIKVLEKRLKEGEGSLPYVG